eukprot:874035-Rhodomonas_salina.1
MSYAITLGFSVQFRYSSGFRVQFRYSSGFRVQFRAGRHRGTRDTLYPDLHARSPEPYNLQPTTYALGAQYSFVLEGVEARAKPMLQVSLPYNTHPA